MLSPLVFTDLLYLLLVTLVVYWALDPFARNLYSNALVRWFPLLVAVLAIALGWLGRLFNRKMPPVGSLRALWRLLWPLLLFGAFVLGGSLYGRTVRDVGETFLNMGMFVFLGGWVTAWWLLTSPSPMALLRAILAVHFLWAVISVFSALLLFPKEELYHSLEHLVIPVLALPFLLVRHWFWRACSLILTVLAAVALNKLTAYLILLLTFGALAYDMVFARVRAARSGLEQFSIAYWAVLAGVLAAGLAAGAYLATKSHLPDGNAGYRLHTYERAYTRFKASPIWGRLFVEPAVDRFELFTVRAATQNLPTHSDWLDILANGGLIATFLFALGAGKLLRNTALALGDPRRWREQPWLRAHCLIHALIVTGGLLVCALNPVLNNTNRAWSFWINVGALAAILILTRPKIATNPHVVVSQGNQ